MVESDINYFWENNKNFPNYSNEELADILLSIDNCHHTFTGDCYTKSLYLIRNIGAILAQRIVDHSFSEYG